MTTAGDILATLTPRSTATKDPASYGPVVLLDQDPVFARLVATWANVPPSDLPDAATECPAALPRHAQLRWYWSLLDPDPIPLWIKISGLPHAPHVLRQCWCAIDNRVVLPDGTISGWAKEYLARNVASRM